MGEHIKEELEKQICESKVSLNELLEHRDFHKLNHIFKEYYQVQLSPDFIGREDFCTHLQFLPSLSDQGGR